MLGEHHETTARQKDGKLLYPSHPARRGRVAQGLQVRCSVLPHLLLLDCWLLGGGLLGGGLAGGGLPPPPPPPPPLGVGLEGGVPPPPKPPPLPPPKPEKAETDL